MRTLFVLTAAIGLAAGNPPSITSVTNAEGGNPAIAPNTWVAIKGSNLSTAGDTRIWQGSDFTGNQMPTKLDGVSVTVNGKSAFVYYISPAQLNILTPPDAMNSPVAVQVTNANGQSAVFTATAQALSPSFFEFGGGPYVIATHLDGSLIGPTSLYPGYSTPAKPGETIVIYANGFGPTSAAVVSGSVTQSGTLSPLPVMTIGGLPATIQFAGLVAPGEFQFNVVVPANAANGDLAIATTYGGLAASPAPMITVLGSGSAPASVTFYVSPTGNDSFTGTLAATNATNSDGPLATFEGARAMVQAISKTGLSKITVQFRGGTYYLSATEMMTAADSGTASMQVVYQNYPGETPVFSGGVRITNWSNTGGNAWKATLPASTQFSENLFYNGTRRLRPRIGGYLGAYYRIGATVYLNAPGPPAAAPNASCSIWVDGSGWECFDRFQYSATDPISGTWKNLAASAGNACGQAAGNTAIQGDIEIIDWEQFSTSKLRISCIDTANRIVYLTGPTDFAQQNYTEAGFIQGNRYLIENVQDALTQPGQWFLDRSGSPWTITYLANPGENPNTDTVILPQIPQVLVATGLQYVTFLGLTFEHDNYVVPPAGAPSMEMEPEASAAVSFQNSQHITFDSGIVTQTSGVGLEFISCINSSSPAYCVAANKTAFTANNVIQNSAFYDIGSSGIRIGLPFVPADTDENVPQFHTVQNNVVEGYGRVIPASFGIGQGMGHDNLYTHNDVYDGYHCAISTSQSIGDTTVPAGIGNANNVISFNHVWNLLQGILNDGGAVRIDGGNQVFTAAGNKILNNKIHDVTDASVMDSNGYGGHGIYLDNSTGLVDVEKNLVYRVSGYGVYTPHGPAIANQANTVKNNIFAFAQLAMVAAADPYKNAGTAVVPKVFNFSNNIFLFDRNNSSTPKFFVQGGCDYAMGAAYTQYMLFSSNLYWRTDGTFASDPKAFSIQPNPGPGAIAPCNGNLNNYTFFTFADWQGKQGEDLQSVVANPGFKNPVYPNDDFSLPGGSPGVGFVVFDPNQAGRTNAAIKPPSIAATFLTKLYNPATDY